MQRSVDRRVLSTAFEKCWDPAGAIDTSVFFLCYRDLNIHTVQIYVYIREVTNTPTLVRAVREQHAVFMKKVLELEKLSRGGGGSRHLGLLASSDPIVSSGVLIYYLNVQRWPVLAFHQIQDKLPPNGKNRIPLYT